MLYHAPYRIPTRTLWLATCQNQSRLLLPEGICIIVRRMYNIICIWIDRSFGLCCVCYAIVRHDSWQPITIHFIAIFTHLTIQSSWKLHIVCMYVCMCCKIYQFFCCTIKYARFRGPISTFGSHSWAYERSHISSTIVVQFGINQSFIIGMILHCVVQLGGPLCRRFYVEMFNNVCYYILQASGFVDNVYGFSRFFFCTEKFDLTNIILWFHNIELNVK